MKYTDCDTGIVAFGKLGGAYVNQKFTNSRTSFSSTNNKIAPEADLGLGYQFNPNWEMDLTANYVYTNNTSNVANNGNLLLGVTYHFA